MKLTDTRKARRWYAKFTGDAYALGPFEFSNMVTADVAVEDAKAWSGSMPVEVWPDGTVEFVDEYEYEVKDTCSYCGGNCPNEPEDSEHLCDEYAAGGFGE